MDSRVVRRCLTQERERILKLLDTISAEQRAESDAAGPSELSSSDQHPADIGTEMFEREKLASIRLSLEAELADAEHALRRLDDAGYGTCEACGRPIDPARLEALPTARFCLEDKMRAERNSA